MDMATKLEIMEKISKSIVYMLGGAFVAGSAVTLLCLLLLDYMRHHNSKKKKR